MKKLFLILAALAVAAQSAPIELNTATAEKKAEIRGALGLGDAATDDTNEKSLSPLLATKLSQFRTSNTVNNTVTIWTVGDSMNSSSRLPFGMTGPIHQRLPVIGYAMEEIATVIVSGTVIGPPANSNGSERRDLWDYGKVWELSTGAVIRMMNLSGTAGYALPCGKAIFYCSKQPGGGTATFEYSRDGTNYLALGTLDTNGTAGELARAELTPGAGIGKYLFRMTATGGPVNYIGAKIWDNTRNGVILANSNMGGLPVSATLVAPSAVRNTIGADMGATVLIYQFREGIGELTETILNNWLDAWSTALPNGEILLIDQYDVPSLAGNSECTPVVNALYKAASEARPTVKVYHVNDVIGSETERDHNGFYNASLKGTVTVNTTTNVLTSSVSTGFAVGTEVTFFTTGVLPAPLVAWTRVNAKRYFVKTIPTATTFTLSETSGGAEVDITDSGSGTHSVVQTDTIHMGGDAWTVIGADLTNRLIGDSQGVFFPQLFVTGSGYKTAIIGSFNEEQSAGEWRFSVPRGANKRFSLDSRGPFGGTTSFGFNWNGPTGGNFNDGVVFTLGNDTATHNPMLIDSYGYMYFGPYAAPTNATHSGYTRGARVVIEEDQATKGGLLLKHKHASPTAPIVKIVNSTDTSIFEISAAGRIKPVIPNYADDAAADADAALLSGQLYRTTGGGRAVYQKP